MTRGRVALLAAIAVVLVAGALALGWWLGRVTDPGPAIVVSGGPVVEASPAAESLPVATAPAIPGSSPSDGSSASASAAAPVVLDAAPGLANTASTASAYRLTTAGVDPEKLAARLAQAFGIAGAARTSNEQVVVGDAAGAGAVLTVHRDARLSWEFADASASSAAPVGALPTKAQAVDLARGVLDGIGVDTAHVDWQVERVNGGVRVTAWQLLDGQRTALAWTVTAGRSGSVIAATGVAAGLQEIPDVAVVGARFAVNRSRVAPWSALPPIAVSPATSAVTSAPVSASRVAGAILTVPVARVTVTDARLGLAQYPQPDGSLLLLPSWVLTGSDGSTWSLIATDSATVDFAAEPTPSAS